MTQTTSAGDLLPPWCVESFLRSNSGTRLKIAYGGRGSGKSWAFARMLILRASVRPIRVLCARELQNSIAESVHALLVSQIKALNLGHLFLIKEKAIYSKCGAEFIFKGLRGMRNDASSIKSMEGINICWVEEAQMISSASLETLIPTIRTPNSEIWFTLNPNREDDPIYQLIKNPPDNAIVRKVNWNDNPWFEQTTLPAEREYMLRVDKDAYMHIWEGHTRSMTNAQVLFGKVDIFGFEPNSMWNGPYQGADWGFAKDPTTLIRCWVHERKLFVEHEAYGVGVEIDQTADMFIKAMGSNPPANAVVTRADSARPETISYLRNHGFPNIKSVEKWKGSVEDGVAFLRQFDRIVIHPRCKHTIDESSLWSFKVDKQSGDVLPDLVDAHNHCWDAIRYALAPLIRRRNTSIVTAQVSGL